jgi:alpha-1,3-rhamnosyl/mannosyltransferase
MSLDLILGVDAINRPVTGIGRYAFELASGLRAHAQIDALRYFSMGRWVQWSSLRALASTDTDTQGKSLRSILAANRFAIRAYYHLMPQISRWQLRREAQALFHSPNYFLPPFPGRTVATVHDLSHILYPQFHPLARIEYMKRAVPDSLRLADHLITDAESVRQEVIQHFGWSADRISAVPLGVDAVFHPRAATQLQEFLTAHGLTAGAYSLCVGTIEPRKNIDRLLTAYESLPHQLRQHYPLVLAGASGWNSAAVHERIQNAQSAGWLRYLAFVLQADLPLLYAGARLLAYPSLYEGFGLPVLEAMASGVPVLTSNVASLPEVVGDAARLVNPLDTEAIASAIEQVLQDDSWCKSAAAKGLERASLFTWAKCVDQTVAVYRTVTQRLD